MVSYLIAFAVVAAAPAGQTKLASMGFSGLNVDDKATAYYSDHFAQQLSLQGFRVITASEIGALIGLERQRQLLGCSDSATSCIAELAHALGVDGVITGNLGKFGSAYQVNIKILAALDGRPLSVYSSRVKGEEALLDEYEKAARKAREALNGSSSKLISPSSVPVAGPVSEASDGVSDQPSRARSLAWVPAAVGGVSLAAGGILLWQTKQRWDLLESSNSDVPAQTAASYRDEGNTFQTFGLAAVGLGVAGLTTGAIMHFTGNDKPGSVRLVVRAAPEQASVAISGWLP